MGFSFFRSQWLGQAPEIEVEIEPDNDLTRDQRQKLGYYRLSPESRFVHENKGIAMIYRRGTAKDIEPIRSMYLEVARNPGGLARVESEVSEEYVKNWTSKSLSSGLWIVAEESPGKLLGSIHAYKLEPAVFSHILSELTIAVHPSSQGKGIGKALFQCFLKEVQMNYPSILRLELIARESNQRAIQMYESLGFIQEGRLAKRIKSIGSGFESDIPMAWLRA